MFDNSIRGGQILLHKIAMFKQILWKALKWSLLVTILIGIFSILTINGQILWYRAWIFLYAKCMFLLDNFFDVKAIKDVFPGTKPSIVRTEEGIFAARTILNIPRYFDAFKYVSLIIFCTYLLTFSIIFMYWKKIGSLHEKKECELGNRLYTAKEVAKFLQKQGKASFLTVGEMPLVKDSEN